jgi:hypothetical protein
MKNAINKIGNIAAKLVANSRCRPAANKIFVSTLFKSGTKLLEHLVEQLTGRKPYPLGMDVGNDYESATPIRFEKDSFFIWHNVPSRAVQDRIREEQATPVFLIRNIYDLLVSQYHHFAGDVDAAIGHSTRTLDYFSAMNRSEGISLVLCGATSAQFHWTGFGYQLFHIQEILAYAKVNPCHVIVYDRLVNQKRREIERLATFLGVNPKRDTIEQLLDSSSLEDMRSARITAVGSGKHFRKGKPGDHANVLSPHHYHMINHLILTHAPALPALCAELGYADVVDAGAAKDLATGKSVSLQPG